MVANQIKYSELFGSLSEVEKKYAPKELYYLGDINLLAEGRRVSVVGSRKMSSFGAKRAQIISEALVRNKITIVSGLAEGIDTVAHKTAIENNGKTISVLGTPLDIIYPKENLELFKIIARDHLAISQFPQGYPFQKKNFPIRNQTMALISDATIIVEASENSGTRHQGWEALRLGRQLYIMRSVMENAELTWPKKMLDYGAQILDKENLDELLTDIPYLSSTVDFAF